MDRFWQRPAWRGSAVGAAAALTLVLAVAATGYAAGWRLARPEPPVCLADDAIDPPTHQALQTAALAFVDKLAGKSPEAAYDMLAAGTRGAVARDKFLAAVHSSLDALAPFSRRRVAHTYFLRNVGTGAGRVACGDAGRPEDRVLLAVKPLGAQAHIILDAEAKGERWAFVLWLVPENGWRVGGFDFVATSMGGKSLSDILALADAEQGRRHNFNAVLLYGAAARLVARGRDLQLGVEPAIQKRIAAVPVPDYLHGKPPLHWRIEGDDYRIDNIGAAALGDKLYLAVTQELAPWHGDADADTRNRLLIGDVTRAVPEYADAFSGFIVVARDDTGGHRYRTVATHEAQAKAGR